MDRASLIDAVAAFTGLAPQPSWDGLLAEAVERAARARGLDAGEVLSRAGGGDGLLRELAGAVTIGETYFYRHREQLEWLVEWASRRAAVLAGARPLEIASLGCASGEEPYSLAIGLLARFGRSAAGHFRITGVDVNDRAVAAARRGVYGDWSFREAPAGLRRVWFRELADGTAALADEPRGLVRFEHASLAEWAARAPGPLDAVLFRNVAIYLQPQAAAALHERLAARVEREGVLVLAPADPLPPAALFRPEPAPAGVFGPAGRRERNGATARAPGAKPTPPPALAPEDLERLRRAVYLQPESRLARFRLALALRDAGQGGQALAQLRELRRQLESLRPGELLEDGSTTARELGSRLLALEKDVR